MACAIDEITVKSSKEQLEQNTFCFPECWKDDTRMGVLLAEFRPRAVNAVSYDSKMQFWKDLIYSHCRFTGSSHISIASLKESFRRNGTLPQCLATVLEDMMTKGEVMRRDRFYKQQKDASLGWGEWAFEKLMKAPLQWGYEKAHHTITRAKHDIEYCNFIVMAAAKYHGELVEQIVSNHGIFNRIYNYDEFIALVKLSSKLSEEGVQAALAVLEQNKRLVRETILREDGSPDKLIKFAESNTVAYPITDIERSIYRVEQSEAALINSIDKIEKDIDETMVQVRMYIKGSRKHLAKTYLKKKHFLEQNLEKKINVLENLQLLLSKIRDTKSDKNIIDAYKLGTNALKQAYKHAGITLDVVDDVLSEMKEVLEQHDEMLGTLGSGPTDDAGELDLEQELSDLIDITLAESNINAHDIAPGPAPTSTQELMNKDFDKEIEKRLEALRVNTTDVQSRDEDKMRINV